MVVVNLYPFQETVSNSESNHQQIIENIDIGGVSLIRAAAKNCQDVTILVNPNQYSEFVTLHQNNSLDQQKLMQYALQGFQHVAEYDNAIYNYFRVHVSDNKTPTITRNYYQNLQLKYGCNPHQGSSYMCSVNNNQFPFQLLQGTMGYINTIDAVNSWLLVSELSQSLDGIPAAASFKHTSPAGVAVYTPLTSLMRQVCQIGEKFIVELSELAITFLKARNSDPMSSFGDFIALSHTVDVSTATLIKRYVSDGIVAPGYHPEALEILKKKKRGKYIILQGNVDYFNQYMQKARQGEIVEFREMYGMAISQQPNYKLTNKSFFNSENIVSKSKDISEESIRDMIVANISLKYAQSNNVAYAYQGQIIGLGAGQQNRVDCVRLAGNKAVKWLLRQHPQVLALDRLFKNRLKRQDKVNARIRYIDGNFTQEEYQYWCNLFIKIPEPLTLEQKTEFISNKMKNISLASDAFFPFRDNIDVASTMGVKYILQPGGSIADESIIEACNQYGITMVCSGVRMFHH